MLFCGQSFAQINVGTIEQVKRKPGKFEDDAIAKLLKTKTIFIYRDSDLPYLETLKSNLLEAWDLTELEFMSYKEFRRAPVNKKFSFFTIESFTKTIRRTGTTTSTGLTISPNSSYTITRLYLSLWTGNRAQKSLYCRIELQPDFPTYNKVDQNANKNSKIKYQYLYTDTAATIYNWHPVYLKNALQLVNQKLTNEETHWLFESEVYGDFEPLASSKLYILDYNLIDYNASTGDESELHDTTELFEDYKFQYEIVSASKLSEIVESTSEPVYYLAYIKSVSDKFLAVFNAQTGEMLSCKYTPMSYNIKDSDFEVISDEIEDALED